MGKNAYIIYEALDRLWFSENYPSNYISKSGGWGKPRESIAHNMEVIEHDIVTMVKYNPNEFTYYDFKRVSSLKNNIHEYYANYNKDRLELNVLETYYESWKEPGERGYQNYKLTIEKAFGYYLSEYYRVAASRMVMTDVAAKDERFSVDERMILEGSSVYKNASKMLGLVGSNWYQKLIMHGIKHSHAANPNGNIYLNTGTSIVHIEGTDKPGPVYYTKKETQWRNLHLSLLSFSTLSRPEMDAIGNNPLDMLGEDIDELSNVMNEEWNKLWCSRS